MPYEAVIGLEVHAQLKTESKIFCSCSTRFGAEPNSQVCPVCLGMPGVLPVLNHKAFEFALTLGLATHCDINRHSYFARKNYFYPDLPKGYQISQFEKPLCENGFVEIEYEGELRRIGLIRIHLEEDAGKSIHAEEWVPEGKSLVDLNRCGTPLIEIVSEPTIRSPGEAYAYLTELKRILEYMELSDCNMEQGSLRCDANVSLRPSGTRELGTKTEMKNMNSFSGVRKALDFEIRRQTERLEAGSKIVQETLLWDAKENRAMAMRSKEGSQDYRYFPEPDLTAVDCDDHQLAALRDRIPELPLNKKHRFISAFGLAGSSADTLASSRELADFFEATCAIHDDAKMVSNMILGGVLRYLGETGEGIQTTQLSPAGLAALIKLVAADAISLNAAQSLLPEMAKTGAAPETLVAQKGLAQVSDASELRKLIDEVLEANPDELTKYLNGKDQVIGFFVGQVMRGSRGKANPKVVNEELRKRLEEVKKEADD